MDSITQGLLGAAFCEASYGHKVGRKAAVFGAICGVLPDLDMISSFWGRWASMLYHRAESHSFVVLPFFTFLLAYFGYRYFGKSKTPYLWWLVMAALALLTHPLLDVSTAYGTQILAPLSNKRFAVDIIGIIDFFYSVPLLIAFIVSMICVKKRAFARKVALLMLLVSSAYLALGFYQHEVACDFARWQLKADGVKVKRLRANPSLLTVFLWRIVAEDEDGNFHFGTLSTYKPHKIKFYRKAAGDNFYSATIRDSYEGKIFNWFADGFTVVEKVSDNKYIIADMRYGLLSSPDKPLFSAVADFSDDGDIIRFTRSRHGERDFKKELSLIWQKAFFPE